jgi:hypothetical protein
VQQRLGPPGSIRLAYVGLIGNEPYANVMWCNTVGGTSATQADLDSWTAAAQTAYESTLLLAVPAVVQLKNTNATLFQTQPLALHSSRSSTAAGTAPGTVVENLASCKVISWRSGVYWRGGKPRTYLPGLMQTDTTDAKHLDTAAINALLTQANAFHGQLNGIVAGAITTTVHGFVSFRGLSGDILVGAFFPILGAAVHPRIGTQRGRLGPWSA